MSDRELKLAPCPECGGAGVYEIYQGPDTAPAHPECEFCKGRGTIVHVTVTRPAAPDGSAMTDLGGERLRAMRKCADWAQQHCDCNPKEIHRDDCPATVLHRLASAWPGMCDFNERLVKEACERATLTTQKAAGSSDAGMREAFEAVRKVVNEAPLVPKGDWFLDLGRALARLDNAIENALTSAKATEAPSEPMTVAEAYSALNQSMLEEISAELRAEPKAPAPEAVCKTCGGEKVVYVPYLDPETGDHGGDEPMPCPHCKPAAPDPQAPEGGEPLTWEIIETTLARLGGWYCRPIDANDANKDFQRARELARMLNAGQRPAPQADSALRELLARRIREEKSIYDYKDERGLETSVQAEIDSDLAALRANLPADGGE